MNRKGNFLDLAVLMIFFFIIIVVILSVYFISGRIGTEMHRVLDNITLTEGDSTNYSDIISNSVDSTHTSFGIFKWLSIVLFIGFAIVLWLSAWMVNTHPVFMIIYIIGLVATIILSVGLSNVYQMMSENAQLTATLGEFSMLGILMVYLPLWISVVGFIGLIIMFVRFKKGGDSGYEQI